MRFALATCLSGALLIACTSDTTPEVPAPAERPLETGKDAGTADGAITSSDAGASPKKPLGAACDPTASPNNSVGGHPVCARCSEPGCGDIAETGTFWFCWNPGSDYGTAWSTNPPIEQSTFPKTVADRCTFRCGHKNSPGWDYCAGIGGTCALGNGPDIPAGATDYYCTK